MARPKTKLEKASTETFLIGKDTFGRDKMLLAGSEDVGPFLLAFLQSKWVKAFLRNNSSKMAIAEFERQTGETVPCNAKPHVDAASSEQAKVNMGQAQLSFTYRAMVEVIASPVESMKDNQMGVRCLRYMLAEFPDFTIAFLAVLRRAFVEHQKKQPAIQRAIMAIRLRKPITDSSGKRTGFEEAIDKQSADSIGVTSDDLKQAKRYLEKLHNKPG